MKKCSKCKVFQDLSVFCKDATRPDGLHSWCKGCRKDKKAQHYRNNKETRKACSRTYYEENKEEVIKRTSAYQKTHLVDVLERDRKRKSEEPDYIQSKRDATAKWRAGHPEYLEVIRIRNRVRRTVDIQFKLKDNLRRRFRSALTGRTKRGSAVRDLGCTVQELKDRLESMFYPNPVTGEVMDWNNWTLYGWHIDHIRPLSSFDLTDPEQVKMACHYTNLQPLWWFENLAKGIKWE